MFFHQEKSEKWQQNSVYCSTTYYYFLATFRTWKCTIKYFVFRSVLMRISHKKTSARIHIHNVWASRAEVYPTSAWPPCPIRASHRPTDVIIGWFRCLPTFRGGVAAKFRPRGPFGNSAVVNRACSKPIEPIQNVWWFVWGKRVITQISLFFGLWEDL